MITSSSDTSAATAHRPVPHSDSVWEHIREAATAITQHEASLSGFMHDTVLQCSGLEEMLARRLGEKLGNSELSAHALVEIFDDAFCDDTTLASAVRADIVATYERDPACQSYLDTALYYKGFLALTTYRLAHWLITTQNRRAIALYLQSRISETFQLDIHPAATIGHGIMIDHATGVVIGETARIGHNVSILHGVTLGGSGKESAQRHPQIGDGVLISVGAKILGNIMIGEGAKIGAGSVVLADVPPFATAVGVPAQIIIRKTETAPAQNVDHQI